MAIKPVDAVMQSFKDAESYCAYLRRAASGWKCGLMERATGTEPCKPEDWNGCKFNGGGKPSTATVEKLS